MDVRTRCDHHRRVGPRRQLVDLCGIVNTLLPNHVPVVIDVRPPMQGAVVRQLTAHCREYLIAHCVNDLAAVVNRRPVAIGKPFNLAFDAAPDPVALLPHDIAVIVDRGISVVRGSARHGAGHAGVNLVFCRHRIILRPHDFAKSVYRRPVRLLMCRGRHLLNACKRRKPRANADVCTHGHLAGSRPAACTTPADET